MVKHVFITSDFGDQTLPRWAGWVKVVVDAEDLPLNVSRETLQSTRFLKQIKQVILKHLIQLFRKMAAEDPAKFLELRESYNNVFKAGAIEDAKNKDKLATLARFDTNQRGNITLDAVRQIYRVFFQHCVDLFHSTSRIRGRDKSRHVTFDAQIN